MKRFTLIFISLLLLYSCKREIRHVSKITAKTNQIDSLITQDSTIIKEYLPYKEKMIKEVNKVLTYAPDNLVRTDGNLQSTLGNLLADLMFEKANTLFKNETGNEVDFVLSNYGGIRAGIWKGDVKVLNAFNLMPFENTIVVVELTSDKVKELFKYFLDNNRAHPLSKQVQVIIEDSKTNVTIHGKSIEDERTYFIATSNYLQKGGDRMNFFLEPESLYESNFLIRDAIVAYFKSQDTLISKLDRRVIIK